MKRIKKVFSSSDQVIHIWASQSQTDARCKNVFFEGKSVYSYGLHYELGRLVTVKGQTVALINARGYSHTTMKHIWSAWGAVSHLPRIKCHDGISLDFETELLKLQDKLVARLFGFLNQTKFHAGYDDDYNKLTTYSFKKSEAKYGVLSSVAEFNKTCLVLGFKKLMLEIPDDFVALINEHAAFRIKRQAELDTITYTPEQLAQKELAKQKAKLKKASKQLETWRAGGALVQDVRNLRPMLIRIQGDSVQTTGGASVPLVEALKLLKLINAGDIHKGEKIGHFSLDNVKGDIVKIGCHEISLTEARNVLGQVTPKLELVKAV